jgi:hypothetical protein
MSTSSPYPNESEDLELHVSICAERYKQLDTRLLTLEENVSELRTDIVRGNKSLKTTLITSATTILVALIGILTAIITKVI